MIKNGIEVGAKIEGLKICPFCNGDAYLNRLNLVNGNISFYVHCPNCGLKTKLVECDNENENPCDTIAKCIEMWNLRSIDVDLINEPEDKSSGEKIIVSVRRVNNG